MLYTPQVGSLYLLLIMSSIIFGDFTRFVRYNSAVILDPRAITFGDFTRCVLLDTRAITFGDFTRCAFYNSVVILFTRVITFGDFTRCVLKTHSAARMYTRSITFLDILQ